jgi:hypothetical protein
VSGSVQLNCEFALKKISDLLPFGGINRWDTYLRLEKSRQGRGNDQIFALVKSRREGHEHFYEYISSKDLQGAACGEMSTLALATLRQVQCPAEVVELDQHQFVVINRPRDGSDDIASWTGAWIFDPWAEKSYPATEFKAKQAEPTIPFFTLKTEQKDSLVQIYLVAAQDHYLALTRKPRVVANNY